MEALSGPFCCVAGSDVSRAPIRGDCDPGVPGKIADELDEPASSLKEGCELCSSPSRVRFGGTGSGSRF